MSILAGEEMNLVLFLIRFEERMSRGGGSPADEGARTPDAGVKRSRAVSKTMETILMPIPMLKGNGID